MLKGSRPQVDLSVVDATNGGCVDGREPWNHEIREQFIFNAPGQGAREMEARHGAGKGRFRRAVEKVLDVHTDERHWRRGAEGEEEVGRRLDQLPRDRWAVIHDLTIGTKGANLDHLVIGPAGVFSVNTKHLTGKATLYDRAILQNGHKTTFVRDSLREATKVQQRLSAALDREIRVWGVVVLMGCELDVRKRPSDLSVVARREVPRWFEHLPGQGLTPGDVLVIERAARTPGTWLPPAKRPAKQASPPATAMPRQRPAPAPPSAPPAPAAAATPGEAELTIRRWKRFGHDRLYANLADGRTAGYIDMPTGAVVIELDEHAVSVTSHLVAARAELQD